MLNCIQKSHLVSTRLFTTFHTKILPYGSIFYNEPNDPLAETVKMSDLS